MDHRLILTILPPNKHSAGVRANTRCLFFTTELENRGERRFVLMRKIGQTNTFAYYIRRIGKNPTLALLLQKQLAGFNFEHPYSMLRSTARFAH